MIQNIIHATRPYISSHPLTLKNLYCFQHDRLSPFAWFLNCAMLHIEIDYSGYNRLLMCSLISLKTQNRCFVLFIATQKMTLSCFKLTPYPPPLVKFPYVKVLVCSVHNEMINPCIAVNGSWLVEFWFENPLF